MEGWEKVGMARQVRVIHKILEMLNNRSDGNFAWVIDH